MKQRIGRTTGSLAVSVVGILTLVGAVGCGGEPDVNGEPGASGDPCSDGSCGGAGSVGVGGSTGTGPSHSNGSGLGSSGTGTGTGTGAGSGSGTPSTGSAGGLTCDPALLGLVNDKVVYPVPALPSLGSAAGSIAIDPTFGTEIVRATDSSDGSSCSVAYSYWPSFNADGTRFHVGCTGGGARLKSIDAETLAIGSDGTLFATSTPGGQKPLWEDSIWSATDPDVIFGHEGMRLWAYDVATQEYTLLKDLSVDLGAGGLWQMSRSVDDNVFAFTLQNTGGGKKGYVAWKRDTDEMVLEVNTTVIDEVQVDKSGKYVAVQTGTMGASAIGMRVANLETGGFVDLTDGAPDFAPAHEDAGSGFIVGHDNWNNRMNHRSFDAPHDVTAVLDFGADWSFGYHTSLLSDADQYALVSTYGGGGAGLYHGEIFLTAIDGSQTTYRVAHHHSTGGGYENMPRANISRDGCLVAFTSDWGGTKRDVFIAKIGP